MRRAGRTSYISRWPRGEGGGVHFHLQHYTTTLLVGVIYRGVSKHATKIFVNKFPDQAISIMKCQQNVIRQYTSRLNAHTHTNC